MSGQYNPPSWFSRLIPTPHGKLLRPRHPRLIAGVCSGIAAYFAWDLTVLRVLAVVFTIMSSGLLILGYAAAWVLIPEGAYALPPHIGATKS